MKNLLTEDLWLSSGMPYDYSMDNGRARGPGFFLDGTAILKGVLDLLSQSFFSFSHWSNWSIHINPPFQSMEGIMIIMGNHLGIWDLMIYHISCGGLPPGRSPRICGYWHRAKYVWRLLLRLDQAPSDEHPFEIFRLCLSAGQPGESFSRWTWWLLLKIRHNHA